MTRLLNRAEFLSGALSSLTVSALSGCFTSKLYEPHKYEETAWTFWMTEGGSQLVVLGKRYHYVFSDIAPSLQQVLVSPLRKAVTTSLSEFRVTRDNVVRGDYRLWLSADASEELRRKAVDVGFEAPELTLAGHLEGVRYSAEGFRASADTEEFTQPYIVLIREEDSRSRLAGKILLTPVAVAADGALVLGVLALIALAVVPPPSVPMHR